MEIEEIKTWQWVLAGLIAGALFSGVISWSGPAFDTQDRDTIEQGEFENSALASTKVGSVDKVAGAMWRDFALYHKDMPVLRDVTVHPPIASDKNHYWVTGRSFSIIRKPTDPNKPQGPLQDVGEWKLFKYPAPIPYKPGYQVYDDKKLYLTPRGRRDATDVAAEKSAFAGATSYPTVVEYLKTIQSFPDSNFSFQFAWWELPIFKWTLPPVAGLLMIGIACPLTLTTLQNYGMVKPAPVKAKPKPVSAKKPDRSGVNAMPAGVVMKQVAPAPPPVPAEHKEYGGEFYPVVKVTHKD